MATSAKNNEVVGSAVGRFVMGIASFINVMNDKVFRILANTTSMLVSVHDQFPVSIVACAAVPGQCFLVLHLETWSA